MQQLNAIGAELSRIKGVHAMDVTVRFTGPLGGNVRGFGLQAELMWRMSCC